MKVYKEMEIYKEIKILFKKPWKILLLSLISAIFSLAMLVLIFQFMLDKKVVNHIEDNYSKVATLMPIENKGKNRAEYKKIDLSALKILEDSKLISDIDVRDTLSGKIKDYKSVNSYFLFPQTNHVIAFDGRIEKILDKTKMGDFNIANVRFKIDTVLGGKSSWIGDGEGVSVLILDQTGLINNLDKDRKYRVLAVTDLKEMGIMDKSLISYNLNRESIEKNNFLNKNKRLFTNTVFEINESNKNSISNLSEKETRYLIEEIKKLDDVFSVRLVKDMNLILPVINEVMFLESGRFINKGDLDKNFCVVSLNFAKKNNLNAGDEIDISLADKSYDIDGYPSGYPEFFKALDAKYGEYKTYKIIGIYSYSSFNSKESSFLYGHNDIFIPKIDDINNFIKANPYSLSFKVNVKNMTTFDEKVLPLLEKEGYQVFESNNKWSQVEGNFNSIAKKSIRNLFYALLIFLAKIFVIITGINLLFKNEYIIRRIFAGPQKHIKASYLKPFIISANLGNLLIIPLLIFIYNKFMVANIKFLPESKIPSLMLAAILALVLSLIMDIIIFIILNIYLNSKTKKNIIEVM